MISLGYLPSIVVDRILSTLSHAAHSPAVLRALFVRRHGHRLALLEAARWWDAVGCPPWSSERFLLEWWQAFVGWDPGTPSAGTVLPVPRAVVQFLRKELEFEDRRREEHDPLLKGVGQPCRPRTRLPSSECAGKSAREFVVWLGREVLYRGEVDRDGDDVAAVRKLLKDLVDDDFVVMDQLVYRHAREHAQTPIHMDDDDDPLAIFRAVMHRQTIALHDELHRHVVGLQFPTGLLEPSEVHGLLSRTVWRFGMTCHRWMCGNALQPGLVDFALPCECCAETLLRELFELYGAAGFVRDSSSFYSKALPLALRIGAFLSRRFPVQFPRRPLFPASQFLLDAWWALREAAKVQGLSDFRELILDERHRAEVRQEVVLRRCVEDRIVPFVLWLRSRGAKVDSEEAVPFFLPAVVLGGGLDGVQRFLQVILGSPTGALHWSSDDIGGGMPLLGFLGSDSLREDHITREEFADAVEPLWAYFALESRGRLRISAREEFHIAAAAAGDLGPNRHVEGVLGALTQAFAVASYAGAVASLVALSVNLLADRGVGFD